MTEALQSCCTLHNDDEGHSHSDSDSDSDSVGFWKTKRLTLARLLQNQFTYQDPTFSMEDMLATLPRVVSVPPVSGGCHPAPDHLATGGQMGGGFSRGKQEDPRCNGTLRKQASPRSNTLTTATAPAPGLGNETINKFYGSLLCLLTRASQFR